VPGARTYSGHSGSTLDWPAKTIKAGVHGVPGGENTLIVNDRGDVRYFTLRELARIQTFPDDHYFVGARTHVARQIGNAVPCLLSAAVAEPLFELLQDIQPLRVAMNV
jgi:DNA (cytosine-5)-methyltransferase 1